MRIEKRQVGRHQGQGVGQEYVAVGVKERQPDDVPVALTEQVGGGNGKGRCRIEIRQAQGQVVETDAGGCKEGIGCHVERPTPDLGREGEDAVVVSAD